MNYSLKLAFFIEDGFNDGWDEKYSITFNAASDKEAKDTALNKVSSNKRSMMDAYYSCSVDMVSASLFREDVLLEELK